MMDASIPNGGCCTSDGTPAKHLETQQKMVQGDPCIYVEDLDEVLGSWHPSGLCGHGGVNQQIKYFSPLHPSNSAF